MRIPLAPPSDEDLLQRVGRDPDFAQGVQRAMMQHVDAFGDRYWHWDDLRHRPTPPDLAHEAWWLAVRLQRQGQLRPLPFRDKRGQPFEFCVPNIAQARLHEIDRLGGATLGANSELPSADDGDTYVIRSLLDEAITSSQIEGAVATREVAREMVLTRRPPVDVHEQMILNNFRAMEFVREQRKTPLSPELLIELQAILTRETLANPEQVGRLRRGEEEFAVVDADGTVLHVPPSADQLDERLAALCQFANGGGDGPFIHPIVRAIALHFWLAYDHPFADGSGRTARALFYWSALRSGYWLFEYVSISSVIKRQRSRYREAFLWTETDGNDLTHFLLYHLDVCGKALDDLHAYIEQKQRELAETRARIAQSSRLQKALNHRQLHLLDHALRHPRFAYTIEAHQNRHGVAYQTARTDLLKLAEWKLLRKRRQGRALVFHVPDDLGNRLAAVD